jgi:L-lactate dehydrogenase
MARRTSIGIIGMGWVGSSVASSLLHSGIVNELLLHDVKPVWQKGRLWISLMALPFTRPLSFAVVRSRNYTTQMQSSLPPARVARPGQTRLDLLRDNADILRDLASRLRGFKGLVVVVTNPVDVMTYVFTMTSGLKAERVFGTGTMLDTARLR